MERIIDAARFVRRLGVIARREDLWAQYKALAAQHGFTHVTVVRAPVGEEASLAYTTAPESVIAEFRRLFGPNDHPLIQRALEETEPFSTSETQATPLTVAQRAALRFADESMDTTDGWTFPIAKNGVREGIVLLAGRAPDMSPVIRSMLHLLAHLAFDRSETMVDGEGAASRALTSRELECLRWVSVGKTDAEIAVILSIKPRTARFHIENAKRKLGVATRVQAVAEAMRLQTIAA